MADGRGPDDDPPASALINLAEAERITDLTRSALTRAIARGALWAVRPGSEYLTTREHIAEYAKRADYSLSKKLRPR